MGSTGFIGAALMDQFRQHSDLEVEGYQSADLDLTSPDAGHALAELVDDRTILIVTARARRGTDSFEALSSDIAIATNVARCVSSKKVRKCLYFSTLSVYGDAATDLSITEQTAIAPTSLYGIAKFAAECILRQVTEPAGIPLVVFRPCKVYGPGDTSQEYGPARFISSILSGEAIRLFGDGSELRDCLFIRDLVAIISQLAFGNHHGTYNLASGCSHSFQEIISLLRKVTHQNFEVVNLERNRPKIDQKINPAKLLAALPGFKFTDLEDGLADTHRFLSATLPLIRR